MTTHGMATRMLDLDDVRAKIPEERRRRRSGTQGRGIQDAQRSPSSGALTLARQYHPQ